MNKIKRPLAIIGFSFLTASCMTLTVPKEYSVVLLALLVLLSVIHFFTRKIYTKQLVLVILTVTIAFCYTNIYCQRYQSKIDELPRDTRVHTGYITEKNTQNNPSPYTLQLVDTEKGNKETYSVKFFSVDEFEIGDSINIEGKFAPFKASKYNFSSYFKDIKGNITPKKISKSDMKPSGIKYILLMQKQKLLWRAKDIYTDEAAPLVWSMGYSDKSFITQRHSELFEAAGISHALVVSGFHVGILMVFINAFMFYIPISKKIKNVLLCAMLILFMSIIGFSPSIVRAGAIVCLSIIASNFKRETDGLTTIGLIALLTTILCPYAARDAGLLLSYSACLGIMAAAHISRKKKFTKQQSAFLLATAAVVFTMPILSLMGMRVTLLSPLFNVLLMPFISVACGLSFFTPIFAFMGVIGKAINFVLVPLNTFVINFMLVGVKMISEYFSFAFVNLGDEVVSVIFISMAAAAAVGFIQFKNGKIIKLFVLSIALISFLCYNFLGSDTATITAFDSGRKPSFIVSYKGETSLLLSEFITAKKLEQKLTNGNKTRYDEIILCVKEPIKTDAIISITQTITDMSKQSYHRNDYMEIVADIDKKQNKYTVKIGGQTIAFGHKKVEISKTDNIDFYFLGNDKPEAIYADNIFIFGNTPKWMEIDNIQELSTDLTIKINLKTGSYKIVKDVYNFGY